MAIHTECLRFDSNCIQDIHGAFSWIHISSSLCQPMLWRLRPDAQGSTMIGPPNQRRASSGGRPQLIRPPQTAVTSTVHPPPRSLDHQRSGHLRAPEAIVRCSSLSDSLWVSRSIVLQPPNDESDNQRCDDEIEQPGAARRAKCPLGADVLEIEESVSQIDRSAAKE